MFPDASLRFPLRGGKDIDRLLSLLTTYNVEYLRANPSTPGIYDSGVIYEREPLGREYWDSIPILLKEGIGDCEDLSCWRAAELIVQGTFARPFQTRKGNLVHIRVMYPSGMVEDPSKRLGM